MLPLYLLDLPISESLLNFPDNVLPLQVLLGEACSKIPDAVLDEVLSVVQFLLEGEMRRFNFEAQLTVQLEHVLVFHFVYYFVCLLF